MRTTGGVLLLPLRQRMGVWMATFFMILLWSITYTSTRKTTTTTTKHKSDNDLPLLRTARNLQDTVAYDVQLFLSLQYLNDSIAMKLETPGVSNDVSMHFCQSINEQAMGPQVMSAANAVGVSIETRRQFVTGNAVDYECDILQTNRENDDSAEDRFGVGFFIMEIAVQQVVYVTSTTTLLNASDVTDIVENGFNRGSGGRVRFLSLLQQSLAFNTVVTVEVLDGSLSSTEVPSQIPSSQLSSLPSLNPTNQKTDSPSSSPTWLPTGSPSSGLPGFDPTNLPPSTPPTIRPTQRPSENPSSIEPSSGYPSHQPSLTPTTIPTVTVTSSHPSVFAVGGASPSTRAIPDPIRTERETSEEDERSLLPLVFGAIIGGFITICVSCFFIAHVWRQRRGKEEVNNTEPKNSVDNGDTTIGTSQVEGAVISFSEESSSQATSTLGDHTAGYIFGIPKTDMLVDTDSLDENTMPNPPRNKKVIDGTDDSLVDGSTASYESSMILPPSVEQVADFEDDFVIPMAGDESSEESDDFELWQTRRVLAPTEKGTSCFRQVETDLAVLQLSDEDSNPFVDDDMEDNENGNFFSVKDNKKTKSFESGEDSRKEEPANGTGIQQSVFSSDSEKDEDGPNSTNSDHVEKAEVNPRDIQRVHFQKAAEMESMSHRDSNNALLRSVLSDAQVMADSKSPSVSSKPSIHSAPPLVRSPFARRGNNTGRIEFKPVQSKKGQYSASSRSVGSPPHARNVAIDNGDNAPNIPNRCPPPSKKFISSARETINKTDNHVATVTATSQTGTQSSIQTDDTSEEVVQLAMAPEESLPCAPVSVVEKTDSTLEQTHLSTTVEQDISDNFDEKPTGTRLKLIPSDEANDPESKEVSKTLSEQRKTEEVTAVSQTREPHAGDSVITPVLANTESNEELFIALTPKIQNSSRIEEKSKECSQVDEPATAGVLGAAERVIAAPETWIKSGIPSEEGVIHSRSEESAASTTSTPMSSPGLLGSSATMGNIKILDEDEDADASSDDSDGLSNPWLLDTLEQTLGPRSATADMHSISGKSTGSGRSHRSAVSSKSTPLRRPGRSSNSPRAERKREIRGVASTVAPRSLENDLKRLQKQLADVIHSGEPFNPNAKSPSPLSRKKTLQQETNHNPSNLSNETNSNRGEKTNTNNSLGNKLDDSTSKDKGTSRRTKRHPSNDGPERNNNQEAVDIVQANKIRKKQIVVVVPPGKLGVVLANHHDGNGTIVSEVYPSSSMHGFLFPGDKLVAINGKDVTKALISDITALMSSLSSGQRKLTIVTSVPRFKSTTPRRDTGRPTSH